jgi:transposase
MGHKQGTDRSQSILFPETVEEYVSSENPVRFIEAYVESLDLQKLGIQRVAPAKTGRPAYHPGDMVKLYIYGYVNRLRSSRQLEKASHQNIEVLWLLKRLAPDFKTIADFRKDNLEGLKNVCREFTLLCKKLGLFGGELIAIDGSKFGAVNSTHRAYSKKKLQKLGKEIDEKISGYFTLLETGDQTEGKLSPLKASELRDKITHLQEYKRAIENLEQELKQSGETQRTTTDPESRLMRTGNGGTDVSYNVQIAVDSKHKLIVDSDVCNEGTDLHQLSRMAARVEQVVGSRQLEVVADAGYYTSEEIKRCSDQKIICYVPEPQKSHNTKKAFFTDKDFHYEESRDIYRCPAGMTLSRRGRVMKSNRAMIIYEGDGCSSCVFRKRCTSVKYGGRRIYRWIHEHVLDALRKRMKEHPEKILKRKQLAEHPFGSIKFWMGYGTFLLRGLQKVNVEMSLSVLAFNLKRAINILGIPKLIEALEI